MICPSLVSNLGPLVWLWEILLNFLTSWYKFLILLIHDRPTTSKLLTSIFLQYLSLKWNLPTLLCKHSNAASTFSSFNQSVLPLCKRSLPKRWEYRRESFDNKTAREDSLSDYGNLQFQDLLVHLCFPIYSLSYRRGFPRSPKAIRLRTWKKKPWN